MYQSPMISVEEVQPKIHPQAELEFNGIYSPTHQKLLDKLSKRGLQKLEDKEGISIKQQISSKGMCSTELTYLIYPMSSKSKTQPRIMYKAKNKLNEGAGLCSSNKCEPFEMILSNTTIENPKEEEIDDPVTKLIQQTKSEGACGTRSQIVLKSIEDGADEYLGKIIDFSGCGRLEYRVYDKEEKVKYMVKEKRCQWEMCVNSLIFEVKDNSGTFVTKIVKNKGGCIGGSKTSNLEVAFPKEISGIEKGLLMMVMLLIETKHF